MHSPWMKDSPMAEKRASLNFAVRLDREKRASLSLSPFSLPRGEFNMRYRGASLVKERAKSVPAPLERLSTRRGIRGEEGGGRRRWPMRRWRRVAVAPFRSAVVFRGGTRPSARQFYRVSELKRPTGHLRATLVEPIGEIAST